jgi:hypothetical protein
LRPWHLAIPILAATMAVGYLASHPAPRFQSKAVVEIAAPAIEQARSDVGNPYTDQRVSLAATAALIAQSLASDSSAADLHARGVAAGYSMTPRNSGTTQEPYYWVPRLDLTADGPSPESADASLRILMTVLNENLARLQDRVGVATDDRITTNVLVPPSAGLIPVRKTRALAGVALLGGSTAYLVPIWVGNTLGRRELRRELRRLAVREA